MFDLYSAIFQQVLQHIFSWLSNNVCLNWHQWSKMQQKVIRCTCMRWLVAVLNCIICFQNNRNQGEWITEQVVYKWLWRKSIKSGNFKVQVISYNYQYTLFMCLVLSVNDYLNCIYGYICIDKWNNYLDPLPLSSYDKINLNWVV